MDPCHPALLLHRITLSPDLDNMYTMTSKLYVFLHVNIFFFLFIRWQQPLNQCFPASFVDITQHFTILFRARLMVSKITPLYSPSTNTCGISFLPLLLRINVLSFSCSGREMSIKSKSILWAFKVEYF